MPHELVNLTVHEVSLVDNPANPHARVMLVKRADTEDVLAKRIVKEAGGFCVYSQDGTKKLGGPYKSKAQAMARLRQIEAYKAALKPEDTTSLLDQVAAEATEEESMPGETKKDEGTKAPTVEELQAQLADANAKLQAATEKAAALEKAQKPAPSPEELMKNLPAELKAIVEKSQADAAAAVKKADEAEKIAKAEREARELVELTKQAETEFANLPGKPEEKAATLKAIKGLPEEAQKGALTMLRAADAAAKTAELTKEQGRSGGSAGSAIAKINGMAKKLVDEKTCKTLAQAIAQVARENPALYAEYRAELQ